MLFASVRLSYMEKANLISIEVVYARPDKQLLLTVQVPLGATILQAIELSGVLTHFPEINLDKQKVGVFSKKRELSDVVHAGERIEIYRPLTIDPKDARRAKAKKKAAGKKQN